MAEKENVVKKEVAKNVCFAQIVKGLNKQRKITYSLVVSVLVPSVNKVLPFKTIYLNEFDSEMLKLMVGVSDTKNFKNDNIVVKLVRGISQFDNVYYLFDISVLVDNELTQFRKFLVSEWEMKSLTKQCGFTTQDIETIKFDENSLGE